MTYLKTEIEKKLRELGFSYQCITDGVYVLSLNNRTNSILTAQVIYSEPLEEVIHLSNNGNEIKAIGTFKLRLLPENITPKFLILAFQDISKHCVEYVIVPTKELKRRQIASNRISTDYQEVEIVFWLMSDRFLYDCTGVGVEWEWYYLSRGLNGRMVDDSVWNYSEFLNDWERLTIV